MNIYFLKNNLIAHRGMHDIEKGIPENSILAFKRAIENNYIIELDLHILKDGNVVVFHDDNLKRLTGINKNIKDFTYEELSKLNLNNTNEKIPLFIDVLKLVNGKVPLLIELKYDVKGYLLEDKVLELMKDYKGKFAIQSFNPLSVNYIKKKNKEIPVGILVTDYKNKKINIIKKYILSNMLLNIFIKPNFISYNVKKLTNVKIVKSRNKKLILGWTIKNKDDYNKYKKYCDNLICENIKEENTKEYIKINK